MKTGRVRAGALLVGVATACAIPAVALGQVDPGKVGDTVTGVTKQVPLPPKVQKKLPSLPSTPVKKSPGSGSNGSSQHSAPSSGGGSGNSAATSAPSSAPAGSARSSGSSAGSSAPKAHASSSKRAKASAKGAASGQAQANPADKQTEVASVASAARPDTGTGGDPKLPFTGYALIVVGALGLMALLTGAGLRGLTRLGVARKRA
jgi:hypothetical protein